GVNRFNYSVFIHLGNTAPTADPRQIVSTLSFFNSTTARAQILSPTPSALLYVTCIVLEFNPIFIKSFQHFQFSFLPPAVSSTFNINEVDLNKSAIFPAGSLVFDNVDSRNWFFLQRFLNST
ncbi:unnamed protein product, partial [marine sediment metagenome]